MIDPYHVAAAHDRMAAEYDRLDDLWYPSLFARLHEFIAAHLPNDGPALRTAIDAGCGTGFQSFLLARAGYRVTAFDVAGELLAVAQAKSAAHAMLPLAAPALFSTARQPRWLAAHHRRLAAQLERARAQRVPVPPELVRADVAAFDFGREPADAIVCCGSVLSFVDAYAPVIARMAAALRPGGVLFLEVEQKRNPDLLWPLADRLLGGALGYEQDWGQILRNLRSRRGESVRIDYPFPLHDGATMTLPIWLFSVSELEEIFASCGLAVVARTGIHHVANLIPSTLLHRALPGRVLSALFDPLRRLDRALGRAWPFWRLGCSVAYCLTRSG
jgi:SAM-dependent methyltransferase